MDIKTIPVYWKKSLEFFKKDNLKIYLLLTLNTWIRSIKILVRNFWWLFVIDLVCIWILPQTPNALSVALNTLLLYATIMTARPSLEAKDFSYYLKYLRGIWVVLLIFALAYSLGNLCAFLVFPVVFFFFDSNLSPWSFFKACKQSFKALACFTPIFGALLILPILCALLWTLLVMAIFSSPSTLFQFVPFRMVVLALLYLFFDALVIMNIASLSVLYTKLKHENFNLLFQ